jgi:hypothetical protein
VSAADADLIADLRDLGRRTEADGPHHVRVETVPV